MAGPTVDAKIRITALVDSAVRAVAGLAKAVTGVGEAGKTAGAGRPFAGMADGAAEVTRQIQSARNALLGLVGIDLGAQGARQLANLADTYAGMTSRLRTATREQAAYDSALNQSRGLAVAYQKPLAETVNLYSRLHGALKPLGGGLKETKVLAEALLAALKNDGASAASSAAAIEQFGQALGKGVLNGDEFNTIAEAAPSLLRALADGLNLPIGQLKKLGAEGQLTASMLVDGFSKSLPQLRADAQAAGTTISGAFGQVNNALLEYVGQAAQTSGASQIIAGGLKTVAENIGPVVQGLGAIAALALAGGIGRTGAALIGLVATSGSLATALSGLLTLIGGPVGLVVALGALAVGWLALDAAKRRSAKSTLEDLQRERADVQAEIDDLQARAKKGQVGLNAQSRKYELDADLRRLNAQIEAKQREREAALREQGGSRGGAGAGYEDSPGLLETQKVTEYIDKYRGRLAILRQYREQEKAATNAFNKEIAAAERAGDQARVDQLKGEFAEAQLQARRQLGDQLKALDKDTALSRVAQYKEQYDQVAALTADGIDRELKANQDLYDNLLRSTQGYFAERARLEDAQIDATVTRLERELADKRRVLAQNEALLAQRNKTGTANEKAEARETVTQNTSDVAKAEVALAAAQRDRTDQARSRALEERRTAEAMAKQREELRLQIADANELLTLDDVRRRVALQYADQRKREQADTGSTADTDALIAAQTRVAQLQLLRQQLGQLQDAIRIFEDGIDQAVERGTLSTVEGERQKFEARARALPQLQELIDKQRELATTGTEKNQAAAAANDLAKLKNPVSELERTVRSAGKEAFGGFFTDIASGAKTAGEAFKDMVGNFAKSMLNLIAQRLGEQLMTSLLGPAGGGGSGGSAAWLSALFLHTGGVVGSGGGWRSSVPAAAWAYAPRYHSGGIAGLKPNEVPAILERGEEVITANDPRHTSNGGAGTSLGGVNIGVTVQATDGSTGQQQEAGQRLATMMRGVVAEWAINESRPGGILFKGR